MAATVESTFRIVNEASRTLREVKHDAEAADRALLRMGASGDLASRQVGGGNSTSNYNSADRALQRLDRQSTSTGNSLGFLHSRVLLITMAVGAMSPVLLQSAGVLVQWVGSLVNAVGGAGVIGGGLLGAFAVGLGSVFAVMKDGLSDVKASQQAFTAYNQAVQMYGAHSAQAATAAAKLNIELKQAPANTLALLNNMKALGQEWDRLTERSRGQVVGLAAYATGQLGAALPQIASTVINPSMNAFAGAGRSLIDRILNPTSLRIFQQLAGGFERMIGPLADVVGNLGQALGRLAVVALPFAEEFTRRLDDWSKRFLLSTQDVDFFRKMFETFVGQFRVWMGFFGATLHFIATFAEYAKGGGREIHGITDALNQWSDWMQHNPARVERFFSASSRTAGDLGRALKFVWDLFTGLARTMQPTWDLMRQLLTEIGGPLLRLLLAVTTTISILSSAFKVMGGPNSALVIVLNTVVNIVDAINWLLVHVPGLAAILSGGLMVAGVIALGKGIWNFVSGVGRGIAGMLTLTSETNAAAAATERLAAASRGIGGGGVVRGGGVGLVPGGVGMRAGATNVARARAPFEGSDFAVSSSGVVTDLSVAGAAAGLTKVGLLSRLRGLLGAGAGRLGAMSEAANPYGLALLLGSAGLSMLPSGALPGGAKTTSILGDVATGAGLGALPGLFGGPIGSGLGALIGGGAGLGYGIYQHLLGGSHTDPLVQRLANGGTVGQHDVTRMFSEGRAGMRSVTTSVGGHHVESLNQQLAAFGGANPKTPAQYAGEIRILGSALRSLSGDQSSQAQAFRTSIETMLHGLRQMQGLVDVEAHHAQVLAAGRLEQQIGVGAGYVDKHRGPGATLDFVRKQVLERWSSLGPDGKLAIAKATVEWAKEMEKQNPALKGAADKIIDGTIGKLVTTAKHAPTALRASFKQLAAALESPLADAAGKNSTYVKQIQGQMVQLYEAYGYTTAEATRIVMGGAGTVQDPLAMRLSSNPAIQAAQAGNMEPIVPRRKHALGGRIGGVGLGDTVHVGGGNMAAPGELIVNHHTENLVNRLLGGHATLGGLVGSEGRPHSTFATGGRIGAWDWSNLPNAPLGANALLGIVPMPKTTATGLSSAGLSKDSTFGLGSGHITGTGNAAANQRMAQAMMARYGWGADQWPSLQALWNGESGWSEYAYNSSSAAQGIPQFLPMPGRPTPSGFPGNGPVNAAAQLRWGMSYIAGRYGTPSTAYSDWLGRSPHWYGAGGDFVARRPQLIGVGDGGPERVTITPMSKMPRFGGGGGGGVIVKVSIGRIDASGDPDEVRRMVTGQIRDAIAEVSDELSRMGHVPEEHLTVG